MARIELFRVQKFQEFGSDPDFPLMKITTGKQVKVNINKISQLDETIPFRIRYSKPTPGRNFGSGLWNLRRCSPRPREQGSSPSAVGFENWRDGGVSRVEGHVRCSAGSRRRCRASRIPIRLRRKASSPGDPSRRGRWGSGEMPPPVSAQRRRVGCESGAASARRC